MLNFISGLIITVLSILGFVELIRIIVSLFMKNKATDSVLLIKADDIKDIEYTVKSRVSDSVWKKNLKYKKIYILLKSNSEKETVDICRRLQNDYEIVETLNIRTDDKLWNLV